MSARPIGVRWTIGDVSDAGFEALRFSLLGARRVFGDTADYAVCVNTVPADDVRQRIGALPFEPQWHASDGELPEVLRAHLGPGMAEGVAWKFAPLRLFPERWELSLDNDCILWEAPRGIREWLTARGPSFVLAEDVREGFGQFASVCGPRPRNSGIRGLPPGFDLEAALRELLEAHPVVLRSELDEQGMQVALLERSGPVHVVGADEVTICSPFWPHQPHLGRCGAHFVGLNARRLPWSYEGRPATELTLENWRRLRPELLQRLELEPMGSSNSRREPGVEG